MTPHTQVRARARFFSTRAGQPLPRLAVADLADFDKRQPCVITGALQGWRAFERWPERGYLENRWGDLFVEVEVGPHFMHTSFERGHQVPLRLLLEFARDRDAHPQLPMVYLAQQRLRETLPGVGDDEAALPDALARGVVDAGWRPQSGQPRPSTTAVASLWVGPHGTLSPLHRDPYHGLLAQLAGAKYARLYPADTPRDALYPAEGTTQANTSRAIDPRSADPAAFPHLTALTRYHDVTLAPGDVLYQPRGTWHMVEAQRPGPCISVSWWWDEQRTPSAAAAAAAAGGQKEALR